MTAGGMLLGDLAFSSVLASPFMSPLCGSKIPGHEFIPSDCGVWCRAQYVVGWSMEIYQSRAFQHFLCFYRVLIGPKGYIRLTDQLMPMLPFRPLTTKSLLHMVLLLLLSFSLVLLKGKNKEPWYLILFCFVVLVLKKKKKNPTFQSAGLDTLKIWRCVSISYASKEWEFQVWSLD